jgi:hypothetical protein
VNVAQEPLEVDGQTYLTFNIIRIFNKKWSYSWDKSKTIT